MNNILLSFDVEEFDIPDEYGQKTSEQEKIEVTLKGLIDIIDLLDRLTIKATFYTTAFFAKANPTLIKKMSEKHEIASHGYYHSSFKPEDIASSKQALEEITSKPVKGFRMARLAPFNESLLVKAGYTYNSSLNPTYLPGRYNNFSKPKTPFSAAGIINLPSSVATVLRIPLFWISFKNFPLRIYKRLAMKVLKKRQYLNIYFHPWEFSNISSYKMPSYTKRVDGKQLLERLEKLLVFLKQHGEFVTSAEYCTKFAEQHNKVK